MPDEASYMSTSGHKREIVRQACDPCRKRKAKCETSAQDLSDFHRPEERIQTQPCRRCLRLALYCTYCMPFGIRGPRKKLPSSMSALIPVVVVPATPPFPLPPLSSTTSSNVNPYENIGPFSPLCLALSEPTRLSGSPHTLSSHQSPTTSYTQSSFREELCSRDLLKRILLDYLEYIYPLIPVVHRPSFRRDLDANRDLYDDEFFGLILGLCAVTVSSIPSHFRGP
jgi:hypothetical protein